MRFIQPNLFLYFFLLILGVGGFFFTFVLPSNLGFYATILLAASGGFGVACYIYYTKNHSGQLVCPVGSNCNVVIKSRYSKFLGVPIEYFGMLYYALIITTYLTAIFASHLVTDLFWSTILILTIGAFLFSLYLLFVQAFLLRQWCIWCLLSAMLSIIIFIFSMAGVYYAMELLDNMALVIEAMGDLGFVLGMGGATAAVLLFLSFLRDRDIDDTEMKTLKEMSEVIWLGLVLTLISQFILYITNTEVLATSDIFLIQTTALLASAISGAILMIIFTPLLSLVPFKKEKKHHSSSFKPLRKPLFIIGAIALSSWYFAFAAGYIPDYELNTLLFIYSTVLVVSVVIGMLWERKIVSSKPEIEMEGE